MSVAGILEALHRQFAGSVCILGMRHSRIRNWIHNRSPGRTIPQERTEPFSRADLRQLRRWPKTTSSEFTTHGDARREAGPVVPSAAAGSGADRSPGGSARRKTGRVAGPATCAAQPLREESRPRYPPGQEAGPNQVNLPIRRRL